MDSEVTGRLGRARDGGYKDFFEIALKFQCALYQLPPHVLLVKALSQSQLFSILPHTPHYPLVGVKVYG